ncbi:MAG: ROK family protein [Clostridia bacterium]|nr:ROK family protein [Clostridia bacterium]
MYSIGIDLGGTNIAVGVVNEKGSIVGKASTPTLAGRPFSELIADMADCAKQAVAKAKLTLEDIDRIGIGIPGVAKDGVVIFCTNLGWHNEPLSAELQKHINKPVYIDNDATVAGLAESVAGISKDTHSSVFITLGTGVGGGIVIDGKPWSGFHGVGSEIGHMILVAGGEQCTCGNKGCLERYCSATALIRMGKEALKKYPNSLINTLCGGDESKINAKCVIDAAREKDPAGCEAFESYTDYLAQAIATVVNFLDPEVIVLGGGVSKAGDFLLESVQAKVPNYLIFKTLPYSRIELARLGNEAGIIGAAMLGREA